MELNGNDATGYQHAIEQASKHPQQHHPSLSAATAQAGQLDTSLQIATETQSGENIIRTTSNASHGHFDTTVHFGTPTQRPEINNG